MEHRQINFVDRQPAAEDTNRNGTTTLRVGIFLFVALALVFGGCTALKSKFKPANDPAAYDPVTLEPKQPNSFLKKISYFMFNRGNEPLEGEKDDRVNILLLGMGGIGHDGPFLTDTIVIASVKPSTNQIALISIPRDLGASIPGHGVVKINHANAYGEAERKDWGAAFATDIMEQTFDIEIPYYVRVDFKAFEDIIDEVGGVTVNVDRSFTDPLYPADGDEYQTLYFKAGVHTMDGDTALKFARSRHGNNNEGSDFARARRQQKILLALKEKMLSFNTLANPVRINNIITALEEHMITNLEFSEMVSFMKLARELEIKEITHLVLDNGPDGFLRQATTDTGAYILEPNAGSFKDINNAIAHIFDKDFVIEDTTPPQKEPALTDANVEVRNGTWEAGLASRTRKRLSDKNFIISTIGNVEKKPIEKSGIYNVSGLRADDVMESLKEELRIPILKGLPENITPTSSTDVLVVLGNDFIE